jgi:hypothetical protein
VRTWPLFLLIACNNDTSFQESSRCDGALQPGEDTVDAPFDRDGDGYFDGGNPDCASTYPGEDLDCDDAAEEVNPGEVEVTCDGIDQDCDETGTPDGGTSGCEAEDLSGTWVLDQAVAYTCALSLVNVNFSTLSVVDGGTVMSIGTNSSGQPGTMQGTREDDGTFTVTTSIAGSCTETYGMNGQFDDELMEGFFTATFTGSCFGCAAQNVPVTATKQ